MKMRLLQEIQISSFVRKKKKSIFPVYHLKMHKDLWYIFSKNKLNAHCNTFSFLWIRIKKWTFFEKKKFLNFAGYANAWRDTLCTVQYIYLAWVPSPFFVIVFESVVYAFAFPFVSIVVALVVIGLANVTSDKVNDDGNSMKIT